MPIFNGSLKTYVMVVPVHPLVSVLMPAYNVEPYVEQAIQSILEQSYTHFELIIADDASTDQSLALVRKFTDPRVRVISHKKNRGYVENMNFLLKEAQGDFLVIQDADDFASPARLQKLLSFLQVHEEVDMVGSFFWKREEDGTQELVEKPIGRMNVHQQFDSMSDPLPVLNATVMFKRKIVDQGFYYRDLRFVSRGQDDDWLLRVSESFQVDNLAEPLYSYRSNPSSMTVNPSCITYNSLAAAAFVRFLKKQRQEKEKDAITTQDDATIQSFFDDKEKILKKDEPAYLELYIAHKWLGLGRKRLALQWMMKALLKDVSNPYIWKKIVHIMLQASL